MIPTSRPSRTAGRTPIGWRWREPPAPSEHDGGRGLVTTVLANAGGFGFPFVKFLPSHAVGIVSLVVLAAVIVAHYVKHFAGRWRTTYAVGVVLATYLNVFVLVAQLFQRIPVLFLAAPTQFEPPFALTQGLVLVLFVWLGVAAVKGWVRANYLTPD